MEKYFFSICTSKVIDSFDSNAWASDSSKETAQEVIETEASSFADVLKLDQILDAEQYAILLHAEEKLGYDGLCTLAKKFKNGAVSGHTLNAILNGCSEQDILLFPIDDEWDILKVEKQLEEIEQYRLKKAETYTTNIMNLVSARLNSEDGVKYVLFKRWLYQEIGLRISNEWDKFIMESNLDTRNSVIELFVWEALKQQVISDPDFININEESKISEISWATLKNMYNDMTSSCGSRDMFCEDYDEGENRYGEVSNFWFAPCLNAKARVIVAKGSFSNHHTSD